MRGKPTPRFRLARRAPLWQDTRVPGAMMDRNPSMKAIRRLLMLKAVCLLACSSAAASDSQADLESYVRVSPRDSRYFELSNGHAYLPIGLNMIAPPTAREDEGLARMEQWMRSLSEQGGNFIRVWLSSPFWDVEHEQAGVYDERKAKRIDTLIELAQRHELRVKLTIEHFREIDPNDVRQRWASKQLHHVSRGGTAASMAEWLARDQSRAQFLAKLDWYQRRIGDQPVVFAWELWNEMNAVRGGDYMAWTEVMLPELKRLFPKNLSLQSLGSFDTDHSREPYRWLARARNNDAVQVHRYLDLGARLKVCHGPVDVLAADAVREMRAMQPGRPILLAEGGAVEPGHTGPFKLYEKDKAGVILHDVLFAPFFAGAAGAGQCWHWAEYVARNDLWRQFRAFADTVSHVDPAAEKFEPRMIEHPRLRIYLLEGKRTSLIWCRDIKNTWHTELEQGLDPEELSGLSVPTGELGDLAKRQVRAYDPWKRVWAMAAVGGGAVTLPPFSRSIVVRVE
jgi:hypothetical protein